MAGTEYKKAEIRRREQAATEGPIGLSRSNYGGRAFVERPAGRKAIAYYFNEADCEFYYHAREDVPALLDALAAAEGEARRLREALAGAVEAMKPMAAETTAMRRCTFCGVFLSTKGHAADCPFRIAHEALATQED